jgi:hypothetical protein
VALFTNAQNANSILRRHMDLTGYPENEGPRPDSPLHDSGKAAGESGTRGLRFCPSSLGHRTARQRWLIAVGLIDGLLATINRRDPVQEFFSNSWRA